MKTDAIIFDIGNVLVDWNPDFLLSKLLPDADAIARFRMEAVTERRILAMDLGQSWDDQLAEIEADAPQHLATATAYADRWVETISGAIQESVDLLRAVRARGIPVFALSNFGAENFAKTESEYPFLKEFDDRVVSAYVGMIKPDPQIYRLAIDRFGVDPAATLFIDDRPENIAAAVECGLQGHLFRDGATLRADLNARGLAG